MFDALGKLITRGFFHNPIMVIGPGRSGTSVLLNALCQHPSVFSIGREAHFVSHVGYLVYPFEFGDSTEYFLNSIRVRKTYLYDHFRQLIFETVFGKHFGLRAASTELMHSGHAFFRQSHWCAKTNADHDQCRGLIELYPSLRVVYIVRNGFDVIRSRSHFHSFRHQDFEVHCKVWSDLVGRYRYLSTLPEAIQVRHEDLTTDPERLFSRIFSFAGLPDNGGSAAYVRDNLVHPLDQATQPGVDALAVFRKRTPAYESWSDEQKEVFKGLCGDSMKELGYEIPY